MRISGDSLDVSDLSLENDPAYLAYLREQGFEYYQATHPTPEDRAARPFCETCHLGHSASLTCDEVAEFEAADREFGSGPY